MFDSQRLLQKIYEFLAHYVQKDRRGSTTYGEILQVLLDIEKSAHRDSNNNSSIVSELPKEDPIGDIALAARIELDRATKKYGSFASAHEGYAVLKEEVDELWDAIKANESAERKREEAIQVAAMALRFVVDCCKNE